MKIKITLLMLLTAIICDFASAGPKITLRGGGKNGLFSYVKYTNREIVCSGAGSLVCPVTWGVKNERGVPVKGEVVIEYVQSRINSGETSGEGMIEDAVSVKWTAFDDGFEIEVDGELIVEKEYELK
jgi:hypothetical protein